MLDSEEIMETGRVYHFHLNTFLGKSYTSYGCLFCVSLPFYPSTNGRVKLIFEILHIDMSDKARNIIAERKVLGEICF